MNRESRSSLLHVFQSALIAVNGASRVGAFLRAHSLPGPVYVLAMGKAACPMARAAHEVLGEFVRDAWIVTKHGYAESLPWPVREAGHPLPDLHSLEAGASLLEFIAGIPRNVAVLVLLSGGASTLVEQPVGGIGLTELRAVNEWLLGAGFDIVAMNSVRKRLSQLKGGRLAGFLAPRPVLCLAISDVPNDDPAAIASGPLVDDRHSISDLPAGLPQWLTQLLAQTVPAPYPELMMFRGVNLHVIGTLEDARQAAGMTARNLGYQVIVHPAAVCGDALEAGHRLARELGHGPAATLHVWGGETTVRLPLHPGRGGRNQSLALAAAKVLHGRRDLLFLAAGTDGSDGPGDDAGALVDGGTVSRGRAANIDELAAIEGADAGRFLEASGDLLYTGPTGTNVMDIMLGLKLSS